ncbi:hypothetical protein ABFS82_09G014900 [Erythranthe guttata]|uniref:PB1 domain-containing protein n=1 Tax=Erythranthe guttata TaxID=4155 RepID=A0A022Q0V5_ERYGU|nr:PREDICTED: uncharacterized protein LOC105975116 [Erythranthe guttata]EYU22177.1 hypothetical protein MIMGU_mgv1a013453mg [Erythranthe guttata]|eukprot:XP_012855743.1 PREDICTED: uncharacterized protein LOC105975116 [Erythranthe guttata]
MVNSNTESVKTIKFLYSYGGRIIPRPIDGKLRYVGGYTRVLAVDRSITYSELIVKFGESCGSSMNLTCKLPTEDLDVLVTIKSDEELRIVVEEYGRASPEEKIRAVLFPVKSLKKVSPPSSPMSCFDFPAAAPKPQFKSQSGKPYPRPSSPKSCFDFPSAPKQQFRGQSAARNYVSRPFAAVKPCHSPAVAYPVAAGRTWCCESSTPNQFYHLPPRNYSR